MQTVARGNAAEFSRISGIPHSTLTGYLKGVSSPKAEHLATLARAGDVSVEWLLEGETPVTRESSPGRGEPSGSPPDDLVQIQSVSVDVAAGEGAPDDQLEVVEESGLWLPAWWIRQEYGVTPDRVRLVRAQGNSMMPTIYPGQRLLVALLPEAHALRDGLIYIFHSPGGIQVKRLLLEPDHVHVWSDNPEGGRFRVTLDDWERHYRTRAVVLESFSRH